MNNRLSTYFRYAKWEISPDTYLVGKISNQPPYTYAHFTNKPKLSVSTRSEFPAGIQGYPLNTNVQELIRDGEIQSGAEKAYVHFSEAKGKLIYTSRPFNNYNRLMQLLITSGAFNKEWRSILKNKYTDEELRKSFIRKYEKNTPIKSDLGKLWNVTRFLAKEKPKLWANILQRLGIDGIVDDKGIGIIQASIWSEHISALFFSIKSLKVIKSTSNVFKPDLIHKRSLEDLFKEGSTVSNKRINTIELEGKNLKDLSFKECKIFINSEITFNGIHLDACTIYGMTTSNQHSFTRCIFVKCTLNLQQKSTASFEDCDFIKCTFLANKPSGSNIIFNNCFMDEASKNNFVVSDFGGLKELEWRGSYLNTVKGTPERTIEDRIEEIKGAMSRVGPSGRFGRRKIFIKPVWDIIESESSFWRKEGRAAFDDFLLNANREGLLKLTRADLVQAMDPKLVRESEIKLRDPSSMFSDFGGATFHFLEI